MRVIQSPVILSLYGLAVCSLVMAFAWTVASRLKFLSLVDAVWAFGIGMCSMTFQLAFGMVPLRSLLATAVILLWSLRLSGHLVTRLAAHYPVEDARYQKLKAVWKRGYAFKSFLFFQFQAVTQAFFAYPFAVAALDASEFPRGTEVAGILLAMTGMLGESIADLQLKRFKQNPVNKGRVCNVGLWNYSRHPNYFFEWIVWCGFGLFACGGPQGIFSLLCPIVMLLLLLFVTGVAPSEEQSLKSRGEAYAHYQRTTSRFVPWLPKKEAT